MPLASARALYAALALLCLAAAATLAQQPTSKPSDDVDRMISAGMTEALEARFAGGRTPDQKHQLARAYVQRARRAPQVAERRQAFERADEKYRQWITLLEQPAKAGGSEAAVRLGTARVEYAGMLLYGPAANDLDELEISLGRRGDRAAAGKWLQAARAQLTSAAKEMVPEPDRSAQFEEEVMAAGLFDAWQGARLDLKLRTGLVNYHLAGLKSRDDDERASLLSAAERALRELVDQGSPGAMRAVCHLVLAMVQRDQGRFDDAVGSFRTVFETAREPAVLAQARYELARAQIRQSQFDEARTTLRPLVEKDPDHLSPDEEAARFYVNLAHVWDAYSYLLEAAARLRQSPADTAAMASAQSAREAGLMKMQRLTARGGPWPALVPLYVASTTDPNAPVDRLTPLELLYAAQTLADGQRYNEALARLQAAAQRADADRVVLGDVLFALGQCHFQLGQQREAAGVFGKLASEHRSHPRAPQAATLAYQLWARLAQASREPADYLRLADTLRNLLESFADHPQREDALWWLPVALELGGQPAQAAERFARVPADHRNWEEAQSRRVLCLRAAWEASTNSEDGVARRAAGSQVVEALVRYADDAAGRAERASQPAEVRRWSAEARVAAAEVLSLPAMGEYEAAQRLVDGLSLADSDSGLTGRVWAVRIRARCARREYAEAAHMVEQFVLAAPPAQVGNTLTTLAGGMQAEVERLLSEGQADAARSLAAESATTFAELEAWARADSARAELLEAVQAGRGQMLHLAGRYDEALRVADDLLKRSPRSGQYQLLRAQVLGARLAPSAAAEQVREVQAAWAALLADTTLRQRAPERYWEARWHWLAMSLRLGQAGDVEKAITQERVWYPDLGGDRWRDRFETLLCEAQQAQGHAPESRPTKTLLKSSGTPAP